MKFFWTDIYDALRMLDALELGFIWVYTARSVGLRYCKTEQSSRIFSVSNLACSAAVTVEHIPKIFADIVPQIKLAVVIVILGYPGLSIPV